MSETYLVLLAGGIAGLVAAFIGGMFLYRNRLRTHLTLRERIEAERTALHKELSELEKEELAETDAGKELLRYSRAAVQKFGSAREELTTSLKRHNLDLLKQIDEHKKRYAQGEGRLAAMAAMLQESQKVIENLKKDNDKLWLENSFKESASSNNSAQLEQNLRSTLKEVARLQNRLAETNMRLIEIEAGGIGGFSRELHRTLSAALQNIDLLLGESVGTLHPMQRNLLETIKASTARLHAVIEDFVQVMTIRANSSTRALEPVDLNPIIKGAIDETSSQMRAKRITLNVDLPENLVPVCVDPDALRQTLTRLLSNAGAASPLHGTVHLRAQTKTEDDKEYLLIQVRDTGGGIPPEDLSRIFTPLYRETDVPARGVGETGMGLFIVKTLTEAQNGRIWVDTELGVGSTYNVLVATGSEAPVNVSRTSEE
jgi:signal transduction histidine kinase